MRRAILGLAHHRVVAVTVVLLVVLGVLTAVYRNGAAKHPDRPVAVESAATTATTTAPPTAPTVAPTTGEAPTATVAPSPTPTADEEDHNHDNEPARPDATTDSAVTSWVNTYYDTRLATAVWSARLTPGTTDYIAERLSLVNRSLLATGKTKGKGKKKRVVVDTVRRITPTMKASSYARYRVIMRSGAVLDVATVYDVNGWLVSSIGEVPR